MTADRDALREAFYAMDAACKWAAGETAGVKTLADANRHTAGFDALLAATVKAGQAAGLLSGGAALAAAPPPLDVERLSRGVVRRSAHSGRLSSRYRSPRLAGRGRAGEASRGGDP